MVPREENSRLVFTVRPVVSGVSPAQWRKVLEQGGIRDPKVEAVEGDIVEVKIDSKGVTRETIRHTEQKIRSLMGQVFEN